VQGLDSGSDVFGPLTSTQAGNAQLVKLVKWIGIGLVAVWALRKLGK
jgi:hypothetical protein